jgi:two-component system sporulation sensor kinase A
MKLKALDNKVRGHKVQLARSHALGEMALAIADSGGGVSQNLVYKLLAPFFTNKENSMGMSLLISGAIIKAHNGHIDFYKNGNNGTMFYFTG